MNQINFILRKLNETKETDFDMQFGSRYFCIQISFQLKHVYKNDKIKWFKLVLIQSTHN